MWAVSGQPATWPRIAALVPDEVLDDYDGPKLFTMRSEDGGLLLAYQCGEERSLARFLLVPFDEALVSELRSNKLALRDALTQRGWAWIVDRFKDG
jgi:hypothetical protein